MKKFIFLVVLFLAGITTTTFAQTPRIPTVHDRMEDPKTHAITFGPERVADEFQVQYLGPSAYTNGEAEKSDVGTYLCWTKSATETVFYFQFHNGTGWRKIITIATPKRLGLELVNNGYDLIINSEITLHYANRNNIVVQQTLAANK